METSRDGEGGRRWDSGGPWRLEDDRHASGVTTRKTETEAAAARDEETATPPYSAWRDGDRRSLLSPPPVAASIPARRPLPAATSAPTRRRPRLLARRRQPPPPLHTACQPPLPLPVPAWLLARHPPAREREREVKRKGAREGGGREGEKKALTGGQQRAGTFILK